MEKTIFQIVFKMICFVFLILMTASLDAQPFKYAHLSKEEKEQKSLELIDSAEYVAEGKVVDSEYIIKDDKYIYLDLTFEVNHWYKGGDENVIHIVRKTGRVNEITHDSGPTLGGSRKRILLLKKKSDGTYELLERNNSFIARYAYFSHESFYVVGFVALNFSTADEFYNFLRKADNIKLPD